MQARGTALVPLQVGGGLAVWLPSSPYLSCGRTPGGPPVRTCTACAPFGHGCVVRPAPSLRCLPSLPRCPRGGVRVPLPSFPLSPLSSSLCSTHVAGMTQARRKHRARLQWGGGVSPLGSPHPCGLVLRQRPLRAHVALASPCSPRFWSLSSRFLPLARWFALFVVFLFLCVSTARHPSLPLAGRSVLCPPPMSPRHFLAVLAPFLGGWGRRGWGRGGRPRCPSSGVSTSQAGRRQEVRHLSLCRGGGGACRVAPVVALPTLRSRVARHAPSHRCLPTPPLCPRGGGRFSPPPLPASPTLLGAGVCGGGRGAHVVFPLLHACRRHDSSTTQARGEALGCCGGGGGFSPLGLPALLHGIGSAPQDLQPLLPLGGSRHVSAWCSVSRACWLLCPYLLEEVLTRVETDDEEVWAAGRTFRTPQRLLAPSAALVEGRAPVSAPNSRGGADCPSSPWCLCIHFQAA